MNQYYLLSQLPSLDGILDNVPLPITEERFSELCGRFLGKKAQNIFNSLTLIPDRNFEKTSSALVNQWNEGERLLRLALAVVRAEKMKKSFDCENVSFPAGLLQTARAAVDAADPLTAEQLLNRFRLDFLEGLRPSDPFSEDSLFYYGLKLKLLERIQCFDEEKGRAEYRKIYNSVMNGNKQEDEE